MMPQPRRRGVLTAPARWGCASVGGPGLHRSAARALRRRRARRFGEPSPCSPHSTRQPHDPSCRRGQRPRRPARRCALVLSEDRRTPVHGPLDQGCHTRPCPLPRPLAQGSIGARLTLFETAAGYRVTRTGERIDPVGHGHVVAVARHPEHVGDRRRGDRWAGCGRSRGGSTQVVDAVRFATAHHQQRIAAGENHVGTRDQCSLRPGPFGGAVRERRQVHAVVDHCGCGEVVGGRQEVWRVVPSHESIDAFGRNEDVDQGSQCRQSPRLRQLVWQVRHRHDDASCAAKLPCRQRHRVKHRLFHVEDPMPTGEPRHQMLRALELTRPPQMGEAEEVERARPFGRRDGVSSSGRRGPGAAGNAVSVSRRHPAGNVCNSRARGFKGFLPRMALKGKRRATNQQETTTRRWLCGAVAP